jgi:hypothetical protein
MTIQEGPATIEISQSTADAMARLGLAGNE